MDKPEPAPGGGAPASDDVGKRDRSKIGFVYTDLEGAVDLAETLQSRAGTTCEVKQLASWMNQSAEGGTFRAVLGAARAFGLVETNQGNVSLTASGREALDSAARPNALAVAFLRVPLHAAMYEQYQGYALPPAAAIERQMETLGVPPKQKERARQTFMKSAQFAGYIDPATGRFIRPAVAPTVTSPPADLNKGGGGGGGGNSGDDGLDLDPLLMALLRKIPKTGDAWPKEQRIRWFKTFAMNVSQIYDTGDEIVDLAIKSDGGQ